MYHVSQEPGRSSELPPPVFALPLPFTICAEAAARASGVALDDLLAAGRGPRRVSSARALALYLAHVGLGIPQAEVAAAFGRHRTSVDHACGQIEERREVAGWDGWVSRLEDEVRARLMGEAGHGA